MRLERIEISGFRGIKRLSLSFDELTTLIGENTWVSLPFLMPYPSHCQLMARFINLK